MSRTFSRRVMLASALVIPSLLSAQKPTAQSLFDKHAAAVGGVAAFRAASNRTEVGAADITFAGVSAGYEKKMGGGKMLVVIDVAGYGQVLQGYDGTIAWAVDPQAGARKMDAAMSAEAAGAASPTAGLYEAGSYTSAEVLEATDFEGAKVWPVKVITKTGRERLLYYDQVTGLKVGEVIKGDAGEQKFIYADYKPFGAIKVPTKTTQGTPNGDIVIALTAVRFDPIDAAAFALPDAVKALP
jgi:hypothetical protein